MQCTTEEMIGFESIITNIGKAYDGHAIFTCPVKGLYLFSVSVKSSDTKLASVQIYQANIGKTSGAYAGKVAEQQGSTTAILQCQQNEPVWVECTGAAGNQGLMDIDAGIETSFSGVLLSKIPELY